MSGVGDGSGAGSGGVFPGTFTYSLTGGPVIPDNTLSTYLSPYTFDFDETTSLSVGTPASYNVAMSLASG